MLKKYFMVVVILLSFMVLKNYWGTGIVFAEEKKEALNNQRSTGMSSDITSKLVGDWKLVSLYSQDSTGKTGYPLGKNARGRLTYESNGRLAVQVMNPNRPRFASGDPLLTSEAEVRAAFGGYIAYYGSYSVNPGERVIVHHVEAALIPNWVGTDQIRNFDFDGTRLTLSGPLTLGGVQETVNLVWERLP
jgi:hypothetical protein